MKLTLLRIPLLLAGDGCGVLVACTEVASASVISMSSLLDGETLGIAEHGVIADADTHAHGWPGMKAPFRRTFFDVADKEKKIHLP